MKLEHGAWVVVADGEKVLLLQNAGDGAYPDLRVVEHERSETPSAREMSSDRAGRRQDAGRQVSGGVRAWGRSAMEETDWHRVAEARFAEHVAALLRERAAAGCFRHLVVVADPRTLGALRAAYGDALASVVVTEIDKDLTNLPLDGIAEAITAHEA